MIIAQACQQPWQFVLVRECVGVPHVLGGGRRQHTPPVEETVEATEAL